MRAWTIVLFLIAFQASLAMLNVANPLNTGMGITIDTSNPYRIDVYENTTNVVLPQPQAGIYRYTGNATHPNYATQPGDYNSNNLSTGFIENIQGITIGFGEFIALFYKAVTSIHETFYIYIGDFNAWILQGFAYIVLALGIIQILTARSLKTAE